MMRFLIPLGVFLGLVVVLGVGLTLNPREVPSPLVGKPAPAFELPRLHQPGQTLSTRDLAGKPALVNFWATWCVACRDEHPVLLRIAGSGDVPVYGINYKDEQAAALAWLARDGNPYLASGVDLKGATGIEFGVYGLPETFLLDADGTIVYKHIGPITEEVWSERIAPLLRQPRS
jgi:cytochrome c biogenesis protein CcmG/thiol:disulfide interchange protein DsbE